MHCILITLLQTSFYELVNRDKENYMSGSEQCFKFQNKLFIFIPVGQHLKITAKFFCKRTRTNLECLLKEIKFLFNSTNS